MDNVSIEVDQAIMDSLLKSKREKEHDLEKEYHQMMKENRRCPCCNKKRKPHWKYCPYCGAQILVV